MTVPPLQTVVRTSSSASDSITALVVADDRQYRTQVETTLEDDALTVRTATSLPDALGALDDIDCLVSDCPTARDETVDDFLERVRQRAPNLPVLLLLDQLADPAAAIDRVQSSQWVDYMIQGHSTTAVERLRHRIRTLVERRRLESLSQRSLASVELANDAIATAAPDGDLEFANRSYAVQFGYDRDELVGTAWQALFTADSVERLETAAIPTVADGWRWTGSCTGQRKTGETFPVSIRLGSLEDDSLVFIVETVPTDADKELS
ncbi:PAS domain-containing protein [Natronorubrum bangense]|uniref:PAS sensor protein n=2 Tax=Natronorubrum bangense TaxID=61858 RepID=L9WKU9_9EURY|nr:PAS domain-containing protein [Natronorubrum bangense]ELY48978.1 PAS sensor protein [Natronorubrum bangense JCM 10635]QCC54051.1 PAS domain-containing protein [Natronorubrum bangense]